MGCLCALSKICGLNFQDPRRLDPRRVGVAVGQQSVHMVEDTGLAQAGSDGSISLSKPPLLTVVTSVENTSTSLVSKTEGDDKIPKNSLVSETDQPTSKEELMDGVKDFDHNPEIGAASDAALSPAHAIDEDLAAPESLDIAVADGADTSILIETDQHSPTPSNTYVSEETSIDLPLPPPYVELTEDQKIRLKKMALERVIDSCKHSQGTGCSHTRMALLARLVAQVLSFIPYKFNPRTTPLLLLLLAHFPFTLTQIMMGIELCLFEFLVGNLNNSVWGQQRKLSARKENRRKKKKTHTSLKISKNISLGGKTKYFTIKSNHRLKQGFWKIYSRRKSFLLELQICNKYNLCDSVIGLCSPLDVACVLLMLEVLSSTEWSHQTFFLKILLSVELVMS